MRSKAFVELRSSGELALLLAETRLVHWSRRVAVDVVSVSTEKR